MAERTEHWSRQLLRRGNLIVEMRVCDLEKGAVLLTTMDEEAREPVLLGVLVPGGISPADLRALRLSPEGHVFTRQLEVGITCQQYQDFLDEARTHDYDEEEREQRIAEVLDQLDPFDPDNEARVPFLYRVTMANGSLRALGAKGVVGLLADRLQVSPQTVRNLLKEAKDKDVVSKFHSDDDWQGVPQW